MYRRGETNPACVRLSAVSDIGAATDPMAGPAPAAPAVDDVTEWEEPAWPELKRQLLLFGAFVMVVAVLFAFAGTVLASGGGCGGG
jgi:hypothetical protein